MRGEREFQTKEFLETISHGVEFLQTAFSTYLSLLNIRLLYRYLLNKSALKKRKGKITLEDLNVAKVAA